MDAQKSLDESLDEMSRNLPHLETIHRLYPIYDLEGNPLPNPYDGDKIRTLYPI